MSDCNYAIIGHMATAISRDEVTHLATLSQLQLSEDEITALQDDLSRILEYVTQLSKLDTSGIEPTYQVTDLENVGRHDEVVEPRITRDELLSLSPEEKDNQIQVPKVL